MGTDTGTLIGVAQALEQKRALAIVADIAAMGDFFTISEAFRAGWNSACEEIARRLRPCEHCDDALSKDATP